RRGAPVTLQAAGRGITVSLPAKALEDGRRGDRVRVLNPASQRVILAEVVGQGQLSVRVE
ncbi:MAG TPA: flagella basal body P-ring formation protein FlgA, partial [Candidatus Aminicenantes bacterium]|nr:flagella basal body P-ring formation protein FlgA [Candidatus Aminicenantes bacterium]